jgi:hypothetical protein
MTAQHGGSLAGHCLHVQLVPARGLCFCVLTNHSDGWMLIEDVAAAVLAQLEGLRLAPGQRTGGGPASRLTPGPQDSHFLGAKRLVIPTRVHYEKHKCLLGAVV